MSDIRDMEHADKRDMEHTDYMNQIATHPSGVHEPNWIHVNINVVCAKQFLQDTYFETLIRTQHKLRETSHKMSSKRDGRVGTA